MKLYFYRGSGVPALVVRTVLHSRYQAHLTFDETPAHVGFAFEQPDTAGRSPESPYFDAVVTGVRSLVYPPADGLITCVPVALPAEAGAFDWAQSQVGKPYDWAAVMADWLRLPWPRRERNYDTLDCSQYAAAAAYVGGLNPPGDDGGDPIDPAKLLIWARSRVSPSSHSTGGEAPRKTA